MRYHGPAMNRRRLSFLARAAVFLALYVGTGDVLGGRHAFTQAVLWLPTGVAVAGMWFLGLSAWPLVLLGACAQRLLLHYALPNLLFGVPGNTLEAIAAWWVLKRTGFRGDFRRLQDVFAVLAAAAVAPLVSATLGRSGWWMHPDALSFFAGWAGWWRMNALGVLVVLPLACAWADRRRLRVRWQAVLEVAGLVGLSLALVTFLVAEDVARDQSGMVLAYLALPVALYAAVRFGARGATTASAGVIVLLTLGTAHGFGPFIAPPSAHGPSVVRELALQAVIAIVTISPLLIAALLAERGAALAGVASEREERLGLLASLDRNVQDGLFRVSPGRGIVYVNHGLAAMLGYADPRQLHGVRPSRFFADAERYAALAARIARDGFAHNEEAELLRHDGSTLPVLVSCTRLLAADGSVLHLDGAVSDITARLRLEEQLRESQKLQALGQLAGGVAHDFNNLLTAIGGYAESLRDRLGTDTEARRDAEQVLHASARAAALTRQLLAYSRRQRLDPQVIDLSEVVQHMSDLVRRLIGENIAFETRLDGQPLRVRVDRGQLEQVLLNLVVNARDAMPRGGTLAVVTAAVTIGAGHPAAEADTPPGAYARLVVMDDGHGMDDGVRRRAFDPFFTTKGPGKGTGLGLSTVHGIVHQSGGLVWIESEPGGGTRVSVALPIVAGAPAPDAPQPAAQLPPAEGRTVLVVEDEPMVRGLVSRTLRGAGYRVLLAEDGEHGLAVARASDSPIHLLVTDVVMPRLGGLELARRLGEERPGLPVLFISGYPNEGDEALDLERPGSAFLQKPFSPATLLQRVRQGLSAPPAP